MEYLQRGLMSHGLDPGGVKPLDASVPRVSGEVAGLGSGRNPSDSNHTDYHTTLSRTRSGQERQGAHRQVDEQVEWLMSRSGAGITIRVRHRGLLPVAASFTAVILQVLLVVVIAMRVDQMREALLAREALPPPRARRVAHVARREPVPLGQIKHDNPACRQQ